MEKKKSNYFFLYVFLICIVYGLVKFNQFIDPKPSENIKSTIAFFVYPSVDALKIEYTDSYPRSDCTARINSGIVDRGFSAFIGSLSMGESLSVPFEQFADSKNNSFNPYMKKVSRVQVCCSFPNSACSTVRN